MRISGGWVLSLVLALGLIAGACGGDGDMGSADAAGTGVDAAAEVADAAVLIDAGPAAFSFSGDVVGPNVPASAKTVVVWVVSVGQDYVYKYGEGASAGATYNVALQDARPPAAALNDLRPQADAQVGVGLVVLVPADLELVDGAEVAQSDIIGIAGRHAIIYREGTVPGGLDFDWPNDFSEAAYECGRCVDAAPNTTFDTFEPADCGEVAIDTGPDPDVCNWT